MSEPKGIRYSFYYRPFCTHCIALGKQVMFADRACFDVGKKKLCPEHAHNQGYINDHGEIPGLVSGVTPLADYPIKELMFEPVQLVYKPTERSRKWRKSWTCPRYTVVAQQDAEKLMKQEGWYAIGWEVQYA